MQLKYFSYLYWSICFHQPLLKIHMQMWKGLSTLQRLLFSPLGPTCLFYGNYVPLKSIVIWF